MLSGIRAWFFAEIHLNVRHAVPVDQLADRNCRGFRRFRRLFHNYAAFPVIFSGAAGFAHLDTEVIFLFAGDSLVAADYLSAGKSLIAVASLVTASLFSCRIEHIPGFVQRIFFRLNTYFLRFFIAVFLRQCVQVLCHDIAGLPVYFHSRPLFSVIILGINHVYRCIYAEFAILSGIRAWFFAEVHLDVRHAVPVDQLAHRNYRGFRRFRGLFHNYTAVPVIFSDAASIVIIVNIVDVVAGTAVNMAGIVPVVIFTAVTVDSGNVAVHIRPNGQGSLHFSTQLSRCIPLDVGRKALRYILASANGRRSIISASFFIEPLIRIRIVRRLTVTPIGIFAGLIPGIRLIC